MKRSKKMASPLAGTPGPKRAYHHGDLPSALQAAALDLIDERGIRNLSMRAVARRAGVTHAAPAYHYAGLAHLLADIARQGFAELDARMAEARERLKGPRDRMRAYGLIYIRYALDNPGRFRVMWRPLPEEAPEGSLAMADAIARATMESLVSCVAEMLPAGAGPAEAARIALVAWAFVHGFAALSLDGSLTALGPGRPNHATTLLPVGSEHLDELAVDTFQALVEAQVRALRRR